MSDLQTSKTIISYFLRKQRRYPRLLYGMVFTHPLAILTLRFLPSLFIAQILNKLSTHAFSDTAVWSSFSVLVGLAIGLDLLGGVILWRIVIYCNWKLEGLVVRDINQEVFDHLLRMSPGFHANRFGGSLVSQTSKLAGSYVRFTDTTVFQVLGIVWSLVFISILLATRAPLFVILLIVLTFIYMGVAAAITGRIRTLNRIEADAGNEQTGQLADAVTNVMAIKSFSSHRAESKRFGVVSEKTRQANYNLMKATLGREAIFGTIGTSMNALSLIFAIVGITFFKADIATVFLILNYTGEMLSRLWDFSTQALRNYNRAFGDAQAMIDVLAIQPAIKDPSKPQRARIKEGAIAFKDVTFAHQGSKQDALFENLDITIAASQKIGLVGHSGSGKTTLTRLLLRFSDIQRGQILIDGQDITKITQDDLRRNIAYVPQEPLLFHRTIRENIAYGKPSASTAAIVEAARRAHALEFIEALPDGFDTLVGERGVKLSGGQRQRIAIARALIKDAPILVLDEATSALDSESEKLIQAALWELMKGRTAIVIAHRLSTIQKMDRIIVLDHGTVIEDGNHSELVKHQGIYASLWAHQSGGFIDE